jgi:hypothetical protein
MARRPSADLDSLTVPKGTGPTPAAPAPAPAQELKAYAHTLSLRMTADEYRRLRRYVAAEEDRTGQRTTHQAVIMAALAEWLDKRGG